MSQFDLDFFKSVIKRDEDRPVLPRQKAPCHDCAVICNLYTEISEDLRRMPPDVKQAVSEKWFCHNHPGKACEGNWRVAYETPSMPIS